MLPYIICGVLAFLYVLTVAVDVYKYKRYVKQLQQKLINVNINWYN